MLGDRGEVEDESAPGALRQGFERVLEHPGLVAASSLALAAILGVAGYAFEYVQFSRIGFTERMLLLGEFGPLALFGFAILPAAMLGLALVRPRVEATRRVVGALKAVLAIVCVGAFAVSAYDLVFAVTRRGIGRSSFGDGFDGRTRVALAALEIAGVVLSVAALAVAGWSPRDDGAAFDAEVEAPPTAFDDGADGLPSWRASAPAAIAVALGLVALFARAVEPLFAASSARFVQLNGQRIEVGGRAVHEAVTQRLAAAASELGSHPVALLALLLAVVLALELHRSAASTGVRAGLVLTGIVGALSAVAAGYSGYRALATGGGSEVFGRAWSTQTAAVLRALASSLLGGAAGLIAFAALRRREAAGTAPTLPRVRVERLTVLARPLTVAAIAEAVFVVVAMTFNGEGEVSFGDRAAQFVPYVLLVVGIALAAVVLDSARRDRPPAVGAQAPLVVVAAGAVLVDGSASWYVLSSAYQRNSPSAFESAMARHQTAESAIAGVVLALGVIAVVWNLRRGTPVGADDPGDPGDDEIPVVELQPS